MKNRIIISAMFAAALALAILPASGQVFYKLVDNKYVTADATSNYTAVANVRNVRVVCVGVTFKLSGSGTEDITWHLDGSVDGSTWVTDAFGPFVVAAQGATTVTAATNIDVGGYMLFRCKSAVNASATRTLTNTVSVSLKRGVEPTTPIEVVYGGTGASTAAGARTSLGIAETATNSTIPVAKGGTGGTTGATGRVGLGIQAGTCATTADGTVTNTFATAFSAAPVVVLTRAGLVHSATNAIVSTTTTNFIVTTGGIASLTNNWIAIGAP